MNHTNETLQVFKPSKELNETSSLARTYGTNTHLCFVCTANVNWGARDFFPRWVKTIGEVPGSNASDMQQCVNSEAIRTEVNNQIMRWQPVLQGNYQILCWYYVCCYYAWTCLTVFPLALTMNHSNETLQVFKTGKELNETSSLARTYGANTHLCFLGTANVICGARDFFPGWVKTETRRFNWWDEVCQDLQCCIADHHLQWCIGVWVSKEGYSCARVRYADSSKISMQASTRGSVTR